MIKNILLILFVLAIVACNDNGSGSSTTDSTTTITSGVENVNGNIPDTTNAISVEGSSQSTDNAADTSKKK